MDDGVKQAMKAHSIEVSHRNSMYSCSFGGLEGERQVVGEFGCFFHCDTYLKSSPMLI